MAYDQYRSKDISSDDDDSEPYQAGLKPIHGDSPAVANGWTAFLTASPEEQYALMEQA